MLPKCANSVWFDVNVSVIIIHIRTYVFENCNWKSRCGEIASQFKIIPVTNEQTTIPFTKYLSLIVHDNHVAEDVFAAVAVTIVATSVVVVFVVDVDVFAFSSHRLLAIKPNTSTSSISLRTSHNKD